MKKKLISLLLAASMVCSLAACGNESNEASKEASKSNEVSGEAKEDEPTSEPVAEEEGVTYPLDTDETLTLAMMNYLYKPAGGAKDITDTHYWEQLQERTGVKLEMQVFETEDAFNLMLQGGELPDIIIYAPVLYTGQYEQMIEDEITVPLSWDEIHKWSPDLAAVLEEFPNSRKLLTTEAGDIYGYPGLTGYVKDIATNGLIVRGDWLEDLGMDAPSTPDEFLDMLRAFKNEKGAEYPMALTAHRMALLFAYGFLSSPYGLVNGGDYVDLDGKYHLSYAEPEFKDLLELVHTMYEEELINRDYLTVDQATVDAMLYDGRTGVVQQSVIAGLGTYVPALADINPDAKLMGIGSLPGANGEKAFYGATELECDDWKGMITTACENKELAMKFLNYGYTEAGIMFKNFGTEGVSYEMIDGYPTYTDVVMNNPDGRTVAQGLLQYCRAGATGLTVSQLEYFEQSVSMPEQRQAAVVWNENDRYKYMTPYVSPTVEYADEYNKLYSDIATYVEEMKAKFISGEESLDKFDAYLQTLKDMGVDRLIEIMQIAIDEFNSK